MLTRALRQSFRRQEGQALVLACLMVLVLSIAVLSTVNIGHMVTERVRLQNTADASAYSTAAMEARAYNFYAFANRTQASHYVSAMLLQSLLSVSFWFQAFLTDLFGVAITLFVCEGASGVLWALCEVLKLAPVVGWILRIVERIFDFLRTFLSSVVNRVVNAIDAPVGKYLIPGFAYVNRIYAGFSFAIMSGAYTHILGASTQIVNENDPNLNSEASLLAAGVVSACAFRLTHDPAAFPGVTGVNGANQLTPPMPWLPLDVEARSDVGPADKQRTARAKRVMAGIANASRYATDSENAYTIWNHIQTKRGLGDILLGFLPNELDVVREIANDLADKNGQTRLLSFGSAKGHNKLQQKDSRGKFIPLNYIREKGQTPTAPTGMLTQGDNLGADDTYRLNLGPDEVSVGWGPLSFSFDNPLACGTDDDYRYCWGDPMFSEKDGNGIRKFALKPSIWALNKEEKRNGTGAKISRGELRGGIHWRVRTDDFPRPDNNPGGDGEGPRTTKPIMKLDGLPNTIAMLRAMCRADPERDCTERGINGEQFGLPLPGLKFTKRAANIRYTEDENHPWPGMANFMHFEPGQFRDPCGIGSPDLDRAATYEHEFNQPSTWSMLNKSPDDLHNPNPDPKSKPMSSKIALLSDSATAKWGRTELKMDNTEKRGLGFLPKGLNVISRGQAYYHRPGNWTEQPNFFNPYWRPRLASVFQGLESTLSRFDQVRDLKTRIPAELSRFPQKIITH